MKIIFIGAGNLATRLSQEMYRVGMTIVQVYSHTPEHAKSLAEKLDCPWTVDLDTVFTDADLYVFSLKDTVLREIISKVPANDGLWVHTAGSMPMELFEGYAKRYGVLYPLQTFSKERNVDFRVIPIFLEVKCPEDSELLYDLSGLLSSDVRYLSSEKRKFLHLAAVFACNFTNHVYSLAGKILAEQDISMDVLYPLIDETAAKIHCMLPAEAQTGPAIRYDENVINKHLAMLRDPDMRSIYHLLSQSIHKEAQNE